MIATERLAQAISLLDFSGILIVSKTTSDWIIWLAQRGDVPIWIETMGDLEWDSLTYQRLKLRFGGNGRRLIASVAHPSSCVAHSDVEDSRAKMNPWLQAVITEYRRKTEPTTQPYGGSAGAPPPPVS